MRRLIALVAFLGLANLVFVQAGSACPLIPMGGSAATSALTGHEGHDMSGVTGEEMLRSMPDESTSDSSTCPAMNACVVTLDLASASLAAFHALHLHVTGGSDDRPASLTAVPELPPPRA
jgi:hypothetical protein